MPDEQQSIKDTDPSQVETAVGDESYEMALALGADEISKKRTNKYRITILLAVFAALLFIFGLIVGLLIANGDKDGDSSILQSHRNYHLAVMLTSS